LPPMEAMLTNIRIVKKVLYNRFGKHVIFLPPIPYQDDLAGRIGVLPTLKKLVFTDPALAFQFIFGPALPATYRLVGPHPWKGARKSIMNCWDMYTKSTRTRDVVKAESKDWPIQFQVALFVLIIGVLLFLLV
ncbi:hypothetical protein, partial [Salmonella sp. s55004]|uniref:hypothetical protein n=1 Tax=Salmonella sp. s55004 TaxID=3159675 RepID=UPI00398038EE